MALSDPWMWKPARNNCLSETATCRCNGVEEFQPCSQSFTTFLCNQRLSWWTSPWQGKCDDKQDQWRDSFASTGIFLPCRIFIDCYYSPLFHFSVERVVVITSYASSNFKKAAYNVLAIQYLFQTTCCNFIVTVQRFVSSKSVQSYWESRANLNYCFLHGWSRLEIA